MSTPTLHDDRIDAMRLHVMHRVEQDATRRGRRTRTAIGLTAASVLVVGLGGYAATSLGGPTETSTLSAGISEDAADAPAGGSPSMPEGGYAAPDSAAKSPAFQDSPGRLMPGGPDADRQVITTGSIMVTVARPRATAQQLSTWVQSIGGRIDDRTENGTGDDASASLTIRVPSSQVTATVDRLRTYGTVDDVSIQNSDVTAQTKDLDARIGALRISIDRLEAILAAADSSNDVIKAEGALTQRQEQLESLEAERKGLADQVSLSTLSIELTQKAQVDSVEPGGFGGGLREGWNALVSTVNTVVEVAGALLPWAAIAAILTVIVGVANRRRRYWN